MPSFGKKSREILDTVDPRIAEIMEMVVDHRDITVLSGFRDKDEQDDLFRRGLSKTQWPNSKHNVNAEGQMHGLAIAIDIAPYPIRWQDENEFVYVAGLVMQTAFILGYKLRWGGNWDRDDDVIDDQTFQDLGHFELIL